MHILGIGLILGGLLGIGMGYNAKEKEGYIFGGIFVIAGILIATGII